MKCPCCEAEGAVESTAIAALSYCLRCASFGYSPTKPAEYSLAEVMHAVGQLAGIEFVFTPQALAVAADVVRGEGLRVLPIARRIIEAYPLHDKIREVKSADDIIPLSDDIVHRCLTDSLTTEYIVRLYAYAAQKNIPAPDGMDLVALRSAEGVIAQFEADQSSYALGATATVKWRVHLLHPQVSIRRDGRLIHSSYGSEGMLKVQMDADCELTLMATEALRGIDMATATLSLKLARTTDYFIRGRPATYSARLLHASALEDGICRPRSAVTRRRAT